MLADIQHKILGADRRVQAAKQRLYYLLKQHVAVQMVEQDGERIDPATLIALDHNLQDTRENLTRMLSDRSIPLGSHDPAYSYTDYEVQEYVAQLVGQVADDARAALAAQDKDEVQRIAHQPPVAAWIAQGQEYRGSAIYGY